MSDQRWKIKLSGPYKTSGNPPIVEYLVIELDNSTDYDPGHFIPKATVDQLCKNEFWNVKIVAPPNKK